MMKVETLSNIGYYLMHSLVSRARVLISNGLMEAPISIPVEERVGNMRFGELRVFVCVRVGD